MPKHVIKMLDAIKDNGGSDDIKALGAGVREALLMLDEDRRLRRAMYKCLDEHVRDKELHTPKGILLRKGVIVYFTIAVGIITVIIVYIPEAVRWLFAL